MASNSPAEFQIKVNKVRAFIQTKAKTIVRVEGTKHFKQSFHDEGFTDETLEPWPDISEARKKQKRKKNGNLPPILTDTGDLGNSINGQEDSQGVTFSSDKAYAARHNEGLNGMPQRQFMGPSKQLERRIVSKFDRELRKIFGM